MRTNIEIDDELMGEAMTLSGEKTKKATVELGLRTLVRSKKQEEFTRYRGQLAWDGNLDDMRTTR